MKEKINVRGTISEKVKKIYDLTDNEEIKKLCMEALILNKRSRANLEDSKAIHLSFLVPNKYFNGGNWLDCASGDGHNVADYFLFQKGVNPKNYYCVDIAKDKLERLFDFGCHTFCLDLEQDDIKTKVPKVDVILCIETLEHLEGKNAFRLVDDFVSVLNKEGVMIISFPSDVLLGKPEKKDHINKHQPDINKYIKKYKDYFSSMMKSNLGKSHLLVFGGKK
jgi:hypothetical protein